MYTTSDGCKDTPQRSQTGSTKPPIAEPHKFNKRTMGEFIYRNGPPEAGETMVTKQDVSPKRERPSEPNNPMRKKSMRGSILGGVKGPKIQEI